MCGVCFCLLVLVYFSWRSNNVHGAVDLGRALESWALLGDSWRTDWTLMFMRLDTAICVDTQRERRLHCETSEEGTISSSVFKRSVAWVLID